jgi:hypothetical protein
VGGGVVVVIVAAALDGGGAAVMVVDALARCAARLVCLSKLEYMSKVRCRFFLGLATMGGDGVAVSVLSSWVEAGWAAGKWLLTGDEDASATASGVEAGWEDCNWFFTNSIGYKINVDTTPPTPAAKASDKGFMVR